MPLIKTERFADGTELGLWEITEDSAVLESLAVLSDDEKAFLAGFRNETRRRHWLSYRLVIGHLLGAGVAVVKYHESGKPYIENLPGHLSVTHSGIYSAVVYNAERRVGIDVEQIRPRIVNVTDRFLSPDEQGTLDPEHHLEHLTCLWAAKEALFKLWGRPEVDFREHLRVSAFRPMPAQPVPAVVSHKGATGHFELDFDRIGDYILVWVTEKQPTC